MWRSGKKKIASLLRTGRKEECPAAAAEEEGPARAAWVSESSPARPTATARLEAARCSRAPARQDPEPPHDASAMMEEALAFLERPTESPPPVRGAHGSKLPPLSTFPSGYFRTTRNEIIGSTNTSASQTSDDERPETPDISQLRGPRTSALTDSPLKVQTQVLTNEQMPSAAETHSSRPRPLLLSAVQSPPTPDEPEEIPTPLFPSGKPSTPSWAPAGISSPCESEGEVDDEDSGDDEGCLPQNGEGSESCVRNPDVQSAVEGKEDDSSSSPSDDHLRMEQEMAASSEHKHATTVASQRAEATTSDEERSDGDGEHATAPASQRVDATTSDEEGEEQINREDTSRIEVLPQSRAGHVTGSGKLELTLEQEAPIAALDSEATSATEKSAQVLAWQKRAFDPEQEVAGNLAEKTVNANKADNAPELSPGSNHKLLQSECLDQSQHNALRPKEERGTQRAADDEVLLLKLRVSSLQQSLADAHNVNAKLEHELIRVREALADRARHQKRSHREALALRHELDGLHAAAQLCHLDAVTLESYSRHQQTARSRQVTQPNSARVQHLLMLCRLQAHQLTEMGNLIAREMSPGRQGQLAKGIAKGSAVIHPLVHSVHVHSKCSSDEVSHRSLAPPASDASVTASTAARTATDWHFGQAGATTRRQHLEMLADSLSSFSLSSDRDFEGSVQEREDSRQFSSRDGGGNMSKLDNESGTAPGANSERSNRDGEEHLLLDALKAQWTAHFGL